VFSPYTDHWSLPARFKNTKVFVVAHARIDQVDEGREVVQIDFERLDVKERRKYRCRPLGRGFSAAGHQEDDAFLVTVGLTEYHTV
jgi:hypothetical protein